MSSLVQRTFTRNLPGLNSIPYTERLKLLKVDSLEVIRLKADLALTFSILHGLVDVDHRLFFSVRGNERTRGHPLKLEVMQTRLDCTKYFFVNRVVKVWNDLPEVVVMASSVHNFKRGLADLGLSKYVRWF